MLVGRRLAVLAIGLAVAVGPLVGMASTAQAATVQSTLINCSSTAADQTVSARIESGDTLVVNYTSCNGYDVTWSGFTAGFVSNGNNTATSPFRENGNNTEARQLTSYSGTVASGSALVTVSNGSRTFRILQAAAPVWTARAPSNGVVGTSYSYTFAATGGSNYVVASGSLPNGLTLSSAGLLSGTPTRVGSYTFAVSASVGSGTESTGTVTMSVTSTSIEKVTICHRTRATTNPYVMITVSVNSVIGSGGGNGHSDHNTTRTNTTNPTTNGVTPGSGPFDTGFTYPANQKWWGDIIPPFTYSGGTYSGLNWGPDWNTPNPAGGTANWLEPSEFAAAVSSTDDVYRRAVLECMDLTVGSAGNQSSKSAAIDTPDKFFSVSVRNGEDPESVHEDLNSQGALDNSGNAVTVPSVTTLETTFSNSSDAKVTTDAASSVASTTATLNGELKSGATWSSWKYQYSTTRSAVTDGSGTTYTYTPGTDSSSTVGAGPRNPALGITGLTCNATYYFRVVGTDSSNTVAYGLVRSFQTSACANNNGGNNNNSNSNGNGGNSSSNSGNGNGGGSGPTSATPTVTPTPAASNPSPSANNRPLGNGRPTRVIVPTVNQPGNTGSTPAVNNAAPNSRPANTTNTPTATPTAGTTTGGQGGTTSPAQPPRQVTPTSSVPAPPGDTWVPEQVRLVNPGTDRPVTRVEDNQGTWSVNPRTGEVNFTPAPNFVGTAVLEVRLVARSGKIEIHQIRIRVGSTSRLLVLAGDVPRDISGGRVR